MRCPCRKISETVAYDACCAPLHRSDEAAPSAEALMRARYSAYALDLMDFVRATWHPSTRPASLATEGARRWIGLKVVSSTEVGNEGRVSFVARAMEGGRTVVLAEVSRFRREDGRWLYVDGDVTPGAGGTA